MRRTVIVISLLALLSAPAAGFQRQGPGDLLPLAEAGDVKAQTELGRLYAKGQMVPQNFAEASRWLEPAAQAGDPDAQFELGMLYFGGDGVPYDHDEAARWWNLAAEQGHLGAQLRLGMKLESWLQLGNGKQDEVEALKWFILAASVDPVVSPGYRDRLMERMSRQDIAEAQRRALEFTAGRPGSP
jgi:FOG: TPR repeat, SEL1 subfamily